MMAPGHCNLKDFEQRKLASLASRTFEMLRRGSGWNHDSSSSVLCMVARLALPGQGPKGYIDVFFNEGRSMEGKTRYVPVSDIGQGELCCAETGCRMGELVGLTSWLYTPSSLKGKCRTGGLEPWKGQREMLSTSRKSYG